MGLISVSFYLHRQSLPISTCYSLGEHRREAASVIRVAGRSVSVFRVASFDVFIFS